MAIKYVVIPEKRMTIGILENTEFDAIHQIKKKTRGTPFIFDCEKYLMPVRFKTATVCDPNDEYNVEEGKKAVKEKLMKNYRKSLNRKINRFERDVEKLYNKVFVDENFLF